MSREPLMTTVGMFPGKTPIAVGKVRDIYEVNENRLLIITTDRISALDKRLRQGIPYKGMTLNLMSNHTFRNTDHIIQNHVITDSCLGMPDEWCKLLNQHVKQLFESFILVYKTRKLDIEAVVRSYISGSLWKAYKVAGGERKPVIIWGIRFPGGLRENEELPFSVFTPTTKAENGHDEPITFTQLVELVGDQEAFEIQKASFALYEYGRNDLAQFDVIMADTKYEFGLDPHGELMLIDEANTSDSSRFWDAKSYQERFDAGLPPISYDKQPVRDWLTQFGEADVPDMPPELIEATSDRYLTLLKKVTGINLLI